MIVEEETSAIAEGKTNELLISSADETILCWYRPWSRNERIASDKLGVVHL